MKIKKYNQLFENISNIEIENFYNKVKQIINNDEYEESEELSNIDLLSEIGDEMNKRNLTTDDLKKIVDKYPNDWYIDTYVKGQLEYELGQNDNKDKLYNDVKHILIDNIKNAENSDIDTATKKLIGFFKKYHTKY